MDGLKKSISSIQSNHKYSIIVIDDGSSDSQMVDEDTLSNYLSSENGEIHLINLKNNKGIEHALNVGLRFVLSSLKTEYIARLDCGDTAAPDRFDKQIAFLNSNQEVNLVGSWCKFINDNGKEVFQVKTPVNHTEIVKTMKYRCSFIHPTVMMRTSIIDSIGLYPYKYKAAEDYDFFYRILKKHETANLPEFLTTIHHSKKGISNKKRYTQLVNRMRIVNNHNKFREIETIKGNMKVLSLFVLPPSFRNIIKRKVLSK